MLTALAIMAGAFAYIQIGKKWGGWRYESYRNVKRGGKKPLSHLINFPVTYLTGSYASSLALANEMDDKENYRLLFALAWPVAAIWIPAGLALTGAVTLANFGINILYNPAEMLEAGINTVKRLTPKRATAPALPPPKTTENEEPGLEDLREELNVALFDQEEAATRVNTLQEKIFMEESRLQGSYREAALPEPEKK